MKPSTRKRIEAALYCSVKGCDEPIAVFKHGLCAAHVQRLYRFGTPGPARIRQHRRLAPFKGAK